MSLDDFLAGKETRQAARIGRRCTICKNEAAAADVLSFIEKRRANETNHTINYFWERYMHPTYGIGAYNTVARHIRMCLGVTDL